jgi:hypothetical protein
MSDGSGATYKGKAKMQDQMLIGDLGPPRMRLRYIFWADMLLEVQIAVCRHPACSGCPLGGRRYLDKRAGDHMCGLLLGSDLRCLVRI